MWNNITFPLALDDVFFDHVLFCRQILWGYIGMALSICGIIGNFITVIVLLSPTMRRISTNLYLIALSCSNILYLIVFIPYISLRYILYYRQYIEKEYSDTLSYILQGLPILTPMYDTILLTNIYLTIAVSIDRLVLIRFSLTTKKISSQRTSLFVIFSIYLFSILYCLPFWFEQRYDYDTEQHVLTEIGQKIHRYTRVYLYILVFCLIPFLTLTCVNITIIQNLIATKRRKKTLVIIRNKRNSADSHITLMLVIIIIVSVLCYVPLTAFHAWYVYDPHGSYNNSVYHVFYISSEFMLVLSASTNFLLYCFFGEKFRHILVEHALHLLTTHHRQMNIQTRMFRLSLLRRSEEQQRTLVPRNSSLSTNELHKLPDSNHNDAFVLMTLSNHVKDNNESNNLSLYADEQ